MITIFTNPRPFVGPFDVLQRNAIRSWLALRPACEIILFNDEERTAVCVAEEFGVRCVTGVATNEFGTPILQDVFATARALARHDILAQVNTDIILLPDFMRAASLMVRLLASHPFLMIGRRWNLDVTEPVVFDTPEWPDRLLDRVRREGRLHGFSGLDYWVFPRTLDLMPPSFAVGRPGMDSWLVYRARRLRIPVVDATAVVTAIHQNHGYPAKRKNHFETERQHNVRLGGGYSHMFTLRDADRLLTPDGLVRPPFPRCLFPLLSLFWPWRTALAIRRRWQDMRWRWLEGRRTDARRG